MGLIFIPMGNPIPSKFFGPLSEIPLEGGGELSDTRNRGYGSLILLQCGFWVLTVLGRPKTTSNSCIWCTRGYLGGIFVFC